MQQGKNSDTTPDQLGTPGQGPQGIDKAPGEEPSQDNVQFIQQSQKGKKVDRDPDAESDQPLDKQDL
jgi:hypothetical protein